MSIDPIEAAGFALTLWMVACTMREKHWAWPLAALSAALYGVVFARAGLYAEAGLQAVFIAMALWGWRQWRRLAPHTATTPQLASRAHRAHPAPDPSHPPHSPFDPVPAAAIAQPLASAPLLRISRLSRRAAVCSVLALAVGWPAVAGVLLAHTDSAVPWWDALPAVLSLLGLAWQGRKLLESWLLWAVVNALSVGLFAHQGLWLTALLYALLTALSGWGWLQWRARMAATTTAAVQRPPHAHAPKP